MKIVNGQVPDKNIDEKSCCFSAHGGDNSELSGMFCLCPEFEL